ncbi:MAG TPA: hypothetical protein VFW53_06805, partial [Gallionella sp.]|nr:hypothetical protein [Gallionella sp.]
MLTMEALTMGGRTRLTLRNPKTFFVREKYEVHQKNQFLAQGPNAELLDCMMLGFASSPQPTPRWRV